MRERDDFPGRRELDLALRALDLGRGLLGAATPENAASERRLLRAAFAKGSPRLPRWTYAREPDVRRRAIDPLLRRAGRSRSPLAKLYAERIREMALEAEMASAVGTRRLGDLARKRFSRAERPGAADALADAWLALPEDAPHEPLVASDAPDPRSLLSRLRAEIARRRLPFTVRTSRELYAAAAVGRETVWVAERRPLTPGDVDRIVLHEIHAHVLPRARAYDLPVGIFALGTARGTCAQEGYALWLEETRGVSGTSRKRELGARHVAVRLMDDGASFVDVVRALEGRVGLDLALRMTERAFRGSPGEGRGLGRERVYLDALVAVRRHLEQAPEDEAVIAAGQVALQAVPILRAWL